MWRKDRHLNDERSRCTVSAQLRACRGRGVVVGVATGTTISLAALTGGVTPALGDPVSQPPTTTRQQSPPNNGGQTQRRPPVEVPAQTQQPVVTPPPQITPHAPVPTRPPGEITTAPAPPPVS